LQKYTSSKNVTGSFVKKYKQCQVKEKLKGLVIDKNKIQKVVFFSEEV